MFPKLVEKRKQLQAKVSAHEAYMAKAKNSAGEYDPQNSELKVSSVVFAEEVRTQIKEIEAIRKEVDDLAVVYQAEAKVKQLKRTDSLETDGSPGLHGGEGKGGEFKSLGKLFVESKALKQYTAGQGVGPMDHVKLSKASFKALFQTGAAPDNALTGWPPETTRTGRVVLSPQRPAPMVIDYVPQMPTTQTAVVYMEETVFGGTAYDNEGRASNTVGSAARETAEGARFAEARLKLEERTQPVRKITVWLPVTDEQLEDVEGIEAYVDQRLRLMLNQHVDSQIINGTGSNGTLEGTTGVANIISRELGNDSIPDAVYRSIVNIMSVGYANPDVIFIHPQKWVDVVLLKTADGAYVWGHPSIGGPQTLWGVPVVPTTAVKLDEIVMGDYRMHSTFALKRGIDMQISNAHGDYFIEGKQAIRMDMRGAMVHFRPKAFAEITGA